MHEQHKELFTLSADATKAQEENVYLNLLQQDFSGLFFLLV